MCEHINCGVIQGFLALRRAATNHVKKYCIFHVCWYSQSAADTSIASTQSGWWMNNKAFTTLNTSQLELSWIMAAKTLKKFLLLTDCEVQTFLEGEENQYTV